MWLPMKEIRALILDFGGVISYSPKSDFVDNLSAILGPLPETFFEVYSLYRPVFDNGQNNGKEYWSKIAGHLGIPVNESKIEELILTDIKSWTVINPDMIQFISDAQTKVQNLSIISNMPEDILSYIRREYQWLDFFDDLIWSCEVGVNKPDSGIYEYCLEQIDIQPEECLFVDDSTSNVKGAKNVGMNAFLFKSFAQFKSELKREYYLCE